MFTLDIDESSLMSGSFNFSSGVCFGVSTYDFRERVTLSPILSVGGVGRGVCNIIQKQYYVSPKQKIITKKPVL